MVNWLQTFLRKFLIIAISAYYMSLKTCLTKQVCENHYSEFTLFGVVQKLSRCWTICNFCETDVSDMLEVCRRVYEDATGMPYGYLLVDLKPDQDERYRLRTIFFPGRCSTCRPMFASKATGMLGRQWDSHLREQ